MNKIITGAMAAAMLLSGVQAFARTPVIDFNGERMGFETDPYITEQGNTMVPFRAIFDKAGAQVMWDEGNKTVIAVRDGKDGATSIVLQIGNNTAFVNEKSIELESAPEITDDSTFVPLRFVMEGLGAQVDWDSDTYTISITTETE